VTTPLGEKIIDLIRLNGPIPVAEYFALCLNDPRHGYYRTRDPFGRGGDFVTAPEISQLFGELIGVFMILAWRAHGRPAKVRLVEIGPGRGTMVADALRAMTALAPDMTASSTVHLVEASGRLRQVQRETLARSGVAADWHDALQSVPAGFTLLMANELFDAIPTRQFVNGPEGFRERVICVDKDGDLAFATGPAALDPDLPPGEARPGAVFEIAPAREAIMAGIASRLVAEGGTALVVDYGHVCTVLGDTLQAVRRHRFDDVLAHPGEADLTSHVDFEALTRAARAQGAHVALPLDQAQFLLGLGLLERAGALGAGKPAQTQQAIALAVERLAGDGDNQMGRLFKALCVSGKDVTIPPFTAASETID